MNSEPKKIHPKRLLLFVAVLLGMAAGIAWYNGLFGLMRPLPPANSIMVIMPYREGWLCPALFRYFAKAPKELYVKAEPRTSAEADSDE